MKISNYNLGEKKVFVIAEIGNNHNGSVELALEMIDAAHEGWGRLRQISDAKYVLFTGRKVSLNRVKILEPNMF